MLDAVSIAASDAFAVDRALQEVNDVLDEGKREFGEAQRADGDGERGGNRQGFFESVVEIFWRSGSVLWSPLL